VWDIAWWLDADDPAERLTRILSGANPAIRPSEDADMRRKFEKVMALKQQSSGRRRRDGSRIETSSNAAADAEIEQVRKHYSEKLRRANEFLDAEKEKAEESWDVLKEANLPF
jgi:hypothetical protein